MPLNTKVRQYRECLRQLSYPEYALNHLEETKDVAGDGGRPLNLSLWNDALPPGVAEAALRILPQAVGTYWFAQDQSLIALLAQRLGLAADNIIITAGADDALRIVSRYCIHTGTKTLIPVPCFGRYAYHAMIHEADISYLPFDVYPYELDIAKIIDKVQRQQIECLYIGSPNNPTGHALARESLRLLLDTVSCSVILDESLLLGAHSIHNSALLDKYQHVYICGSFSKLYGLPGLRVGYLIASRAHTAQLRKLVSPFGVDALALEIAKHMLGQDDWLRQRIAAIRQGIRLLRSIDSPYFRVTRTSAPVALVDYTGGLGSLHHLLRSQNIATVASAEFPGLDETNAVRVIIKNMNDMLQLNRALAQLS